MSVVVCYLEEEESVGGEDCVVDLKRFQEVYYSCLALHELLLLLKKLVLVFGLTELQHLVLLLQTGTDGVERLLV